MTIDELYDWLRDRLEDADYDEVSGFLTSYVADNNNFHEAAAAKIAEHEANEREMQDEIKALKVRNYDLLMQVPAEEKPAEEHEEVEETGEVTIDDLFEEDKEGK